MRPALTENEAWLRGTKSKAQPHGGSVFAFGRPKKPKDLSTEASAEWDRILRQLIKRKTSTALDASSLETYCRNFALWKAFMIEAENDPMIDEPFLDKAGVVHTRRITNPAARYATALGNLLARYQREFAATPASREAAQPTAPPAKPKNTLVEGSKAWLEEQQRLEQLSYGEDETPPVQEETSDPITTD